ncbi:hypothetical protein AKJ16_DCAP26827 [Drosera capensis]
MLSTRHLLLLRSSSILTLPRHFSSYVSSPAAVEAERAIERGPRHDWTRHEIGDVYRAEVPHYRHHPSTIDA